MGAVDPAAERRPPPERVVVPEDGPFWEAVDDGAIALVRCDSCGAWSRFARSCVACGGRDFTWTRVSGAGEVASFAVFHRAYHPHFEDSLPYNVAVVRLAEGPELVTNVVDVDLSELAVGLPVTLECRPRGDALIPQAIPRRPTAEQLPPTSEPTTRRA